jgi:hypothetical protein
VVAAGHNVDPGREYVIGRRARQAEAFGGILAVRDDEVDSTVAHQRGKDPGDCLDPGRPDHVAKHQDPADSSHVTYLSKHKRHRCMKRAAPKDGPLVDSAAYYRARDPRPNAPRLLAKFALAKFALAIIISRIPRFASPG